MIVLHALNRLHLHDEVLNVIRRILMQKRGRSNLIRKEEVELNLASNGRFLCADAGSDDTRLKKNDTRIYRIAPGKQGSLPLERNEPAA